MTKTKKKNVQTSQNSFLGNVLDSLIFSSYEFFAQTNTDFDFKNEIFYKLYLTVTQNQRWKKGFCGKNLGGPLYRIFIILNFYLLFLSLKKAQNSKRIQLREHSCVLKEIGMSKIPTENALFKKFSEPITLECATSTLNTLCLEFLKSFYWALFVGCLVH